MEDKIIEEEYVSDYIQGAFALFFKKGVKLISQVTKRSLVSNSFSIK